MRFGSTPHTRTRSPTRVVRLRRCLWCDGRRAPAPSLSGIVTSAPGAAAATQPRWERSPVSVGGACNAKVPTPSTVTWFRPKYRRLPLLATGWPSITVKESAAMGSPWFSVAIPCAVFEPAPTAYTLAVRASSPYTVPSAAMAIRPPPPRLMVAVAVVGEMCATPSAPPTHTSPRSVSMIAAVRPPTSVRIAAVVAVESAVPMVDWLIPEAFCGSARMASPSCCAMSKFCDCALTLASGSRSLTL